MWKRYSAEITHRWDLTGFDIQEEHPRPQYLARLTHVKRQEINVITNTMEPYVPFWKMKFPITLLSFSVVILLVSNNNHNYFVLFILSTGHFGTCNCVGGCYVSLMRYGSSGGVLERRRKRFGYYVHNGNSSLHKFVLHCRLQLGKLTFHYLLFGSIRTYF